ncbi:hypothetical protein BCR42DRAFT_412803 [Absidia repens]|uniref:GATA-type domain-containing protein n=1 Tax=Absidia repens TaxID=90262 RepID=A0A1X2IK91_9FUNG|nr:hypothetical protein BCR42DRAFT_412803 [Absidia repens]
MSSSAISAAKRRTETALKNYKIPTSTNRAEPSQDTLNDQVLLSLLQSRLTWSTNVFTKYRPDPEQQPKRSTVIRRRFPMMVELGQATLELGPHLFYETSFYEAVRSDSWLSLGKVAGVDGLDAYETKPLEAVVPPKVDETIAANNNTDTQQQQEQQEHQPQQQEQQSQQQEQLPQQQEQLPQQQQQKVGNGNDKSELENEMDITTTDLTTQSTSRVTSSTNGVDSQTTTDQSSLDTTDITQSASTDTNNAVIQDATPALSSSDPNDKAPDDCLIYRDIVIEFKDQPSERYLFPKDAIMQVLEDSVTAKFSFMLPLDRTCADYFFWDANKKLQHFGDQSSIPEIKAMSTSTIPNTTDPATTAITDKQNYQPVNIRLLDASTAIIDALRSTIHNPDQVRTKMISQMQKVPDRAYLDYSISKSEQQAIHDLIHRVHTQPDIISGPIAAEKKRNEIGLAIKLGKRPETDQHEAEPPKTKQHIPGKEDEFRKCVYCSTRYTVMWRKGPAGEGTLCNGCGILWLQGKILIGAPVISKEEERQQIKERWRIASRKREQEEWAWKQQRIKEEQEAVIKEEQETAHRMELCIKAKKRRALSSHRHNTVKANGGSQPSIPPTQQQTAPAIPPYAPMPTSFDHQHHIIATNGHTGAGIGMVAAQMAHQQHQNAQMQNPNHNTQQVMPNVQTQPLVAPLSNSAPTPITAAAAASTTTTTTTTTAAIQPSPTPTQEQPPASSSSYHIFDLPQIPLPTLCIELPHNTMFSHPNCTVALSHQKQFSIQLTKDNVSITVHIPRQALAAATKFEILGQLDSAGRDILLMSCTPEDVGRGPGVPLEAFGSVLYDPKDPDRRLNIRFLEKIDALGGPVVKKILECWLAEK